MQLKQGTLLQGGKYRIVRTLGQGGFGITYLAEQPMLERRVCIKEFFFKEYCEREEETSHVTITTKSNAELVERFRKKFVKEARVISKLYHDHIIQIHDIFEENATAYYVMEYVEGESLGDMIRRVGFLPEQQALAYISDVADALAYIHSKSINHLDIKPGNIMLRREDHRILLIDFGVSKQYDQDTFEGTTTTPVGISHGYSPAEQYRKNGVQSFSPQSDVYALAATLYKMLTGVTPPEAIEVQDEGLPLAPLNAKNVSSATTAAIVNAMKSRTQRTQNIGAFLADLNGDVEVTIVTEPTPAPKPNPMPTPGPKSARLSVWKWIISGVVAAAIIISFAVGQQEKNESPDMGDNDIIAANQINSEDSQHQSTTGTLNGYDWVDLALSVKWATKNVGASSPSDYGDYFAWGETQTKSTYTWSNCFDCLDNEGKSWGTYKIGGKTSISPTSGRDTARENWGGTWRMPTIAEFEELCNKCDWTWTSKGGHNGYLVTSKTNGNSIFLPAAGFRDGTDRFDVGEYGSFWSSTLSSSNSSYACGLYFDSSYRNTSYGNERSFGQSVRPVTE